MNSSQCLSYNNFHVLIFDLSVFYLVSLYNSLGYPKQLYTHTHTHTYGASLVAGIGYPLQYSWAFLVAQMVDSQESACNAGDLGSIPGSGRSPGEGNGNPLQYSCLENFMDRGSWLQSMGSQSTGHDWVTNTCHPSSSLSPVSTFTYLCCKLFFNWSP